MIILLVLVFVLLPFNLIVILVIVIGVIVIILKSEKSAYLPWLINLINYYHLSTQSHLLECAILIEILISARPHKLQYLDLQISNRSDILESGRLRYYFILPHPSRCVVILKISDEEYGKSDFRHIVLSVNIWILLSFALVITGLRLYENSKYSKTAPGQVCQID